MALLERQFLNGRDRPESCIRLTAHWVDGLRFKDNKWKFEEEEFLPHIGTGQFRCKVHLYSLERTDFDRGSTEKSTRDVDLRFDLDGVSAQFIGTILLLTIPLDLFWEKTDNPSKNPKMFRYLQSLRLPVGNSTPFDLQILVTYRNLHELFGSNRMFVEDREREGFRWVGSVGTLP
jgi:hypothetical protein